MISAYVRDHRAGGLGSVVSLAEVHCRKSLLKTVDGEQHLLFQSNRHVLQIRCIGQDIRTKPFVFEPVVDKFPHVEQPQRLIRQLADLYRNRLIGGPQGGWTVEATRHRDALIAIDLRRKGWLFQDIARFIHGDRLVDEEWTNPNATLKNRMSRSHQRALRNIAGDYRKLLV